MSKCPKQNDGSPEVTRRGAFRRIGRWVGLGGLAALMARSVLGPRRAGGAVSLCTRCPALRQCDREDGAVTRRAMNIQRIAPDEQRRELCAGRRRESEAARRNT
jgi:hypothetical protein